MKTIEEHLNRNKSTFKTMGKDIIKLDWVFSKWYEKLILLLSFLWSIWSLILWLWRFI